MITTPPARRRYPLRHEAVRPPPLATKRLAAVLRKRRGRPGSRIVRARRQDDFLGPGQRIAPGATDRLGAGVRLRIVQEV